MLSLFLLILGLIAAIGILATIPRIPGNALRGAAACFALLVFLLFALVSSVRYVPEDKVGVVIKNVGFTNLPPGRIIATDGEKGPQANILGPGWHYWYWPIVYDIQFEQITTIPEEEIGMITTQDGAPLPEGEIYAPEWKQQEIGDMLKAEYFLTNGGGYKGPQATVLTPGQYRLNTKLFKVETVPVTNIEKATVGVIKSNVGQIPERGGSEVQLVDKGERGIWKLPLMPQKLYLNTEAYEVTIISTKRNVVRYTTSVSQEEEREIKVRTSDGFEFPVDVRVEYEIKPEDAPIVVATLGDDKDKLLDVLNSAVRAIFRNNAERVKALDYVQQRSLQESQSLEMLREEMSNSGVTVNAVRIGDVRIDQAADNQLAKLLATQTDREIAVQEEITFQQQQKALEQKKEVSRTEQEAEEERRLATAQYEVKIAEQDKERRIIEAGAEAEAITIKAKAQADAYMMIAQQIGKGNAALVELLKIVGERGINITPRVMVIGDSGAAQSNAAGNSGTAAGQRAETTALIGTMLDTMISRNTENASGDETGDPPSRPAERDDQN